jgi:hypothetical protein
MSKITESLLNVKINKYFLKKIALLYLQKLIEDFQNKSTDSSNLMKRKEKLYKILSKNIFKGKRMNNKNPQKL